MRRDETRRLDGGKGRRWRRHGISKLCVTRRRRPRGVDSWVMAVRWRPGRVRSFSWYREMRYPPNTPTDPLPYDRTTQSSSIFLSPVVGRKRTRLSIRGRSGFPRRAGHMPHRRWALYCRIRSGDKTATLLPDRTWPMRAVDLVPPLRLNDNTVPISPLSTSGRLFMSEAART